MERYEVTEKDKQLIAAGLDVLSKNFDDGIYHHTVGCALLCKNGKVTLKQRFSARYANSVQNTLSACEVLKHLCFGIRKL